MKDTFLSFPIQRADITNYEEGWANTRCGIPNDKGAQAEFIIVTLLLLDLWHEGGSEAWGSGWEASLSRPEDSTGPMDKSQTAFSALDCYTLK